ncbi:MAG: J domain-containing protein [Sulfurovum sp.]|nr:J domain-containing protein [Sulfurovum sp.]
MQNSVEIIEEALEVLEMPKFITQKDLKKQYHFLARKYHPDLGGDAEKMEVLNNAYKILIRYIEDFRYTFSEDEINKQFSGEGYAQRFKP